jgi:hypothetical protein
MAKTKVTRDLADGNVQTPSVRVTSPLEVAQYFYAHSFAGDSGRKSTDGEHENQSSCGDHGTSTQTKYSVLLYLPMCNQSKVSFRPTPFFF